MSTPVLSQSKARPRHDRPAVRPLRNGEHVARAEFERRWEATPGVQRAELIEGITFMPSPVSGTHSDCHGQLQYWLAHYAQATPGVKMLIAPSLRLDYRNEFQPDCVLRIASPNLGRSSLSSDDYIEGAPELVAEVAVSSADYDAYEKRAVYERIGVQEYLLWQVLDGRFDWWTLTEGVYVPLPARPDGVHASLVLPGLWLDLRALLAGEGKRVLNPLRKGLASAAHRQFVRSLVRK